MLTFVTRAGVGVDKPEEKVVFLFTDIIVTSNPMWIPKKGKRNFILLMKQN